MCLYSQPDTQLLPPQLLRDPVSPAEVDVTSYEQTSLYLLKYKRKNAFIRRCFHLRYIG